MLDLGGELHTAQTTSYGACKRDGAKSLVYIYDEVRSSWDSATSGVEVIDPFV
jgi:hypothetical protein